SARNMRSPDESTNVSRLRSIVSVLTSDFNVAFTAASTRGTVAMSSSPESANRALSRSRSFSSSNGVRGTYCHSLPVSSSVHARQLFESPPGGRLPAVVHYHHRSIVSFAAELKFGRSGGRACTLCSARADAGVSVELRLLAPQLSDGGIAIHPLARDPVPVVARAQLREHGEREHLHAPAEQVLGAHVLVAHLAKVARARVGALDHHLRGDLGRELDDLVGRVPPDRRLDEVEQVLGVDALGVRQEARLGQQPMQGRVVALGDGALSGELEVDRSAVEPLEQAEIEERHATVVEQQEVAGVRVAGELAVAIQAAEEEAEDDLADAIALGLRASLQLLEADAVHELADEHALARERGDDAGHVDERVAIEDAGQRTLVLGLQLVVELLDDALPDLY